MNYAQALGYLLDRETYLRRAQGGRATLANPMRMAQLLDALGNPQTRFQAVHIAGTKGKGSTSALCESMLHGAGYRTGLFTSPHLHTFRERIRVDQQLIDAQDVADLLTRLRPIFDAMPDLTVFDRITATAFVYFAEQGVEWAVLETGVGGRLDSTTVVTPAVCGITSISYDHMKLLGDTLALIAREKAGIIKPDVPVFTSHQDAEALAVLQEVAQDRGVPLVITVPRDQPPPNMPGDHQRINAGLALAMVESLALRGLIQADPTQRETGLAKTQWPGRFERLPAPEAAEVPLIVDCAHNAESMDCLVETLARYYPQRPVTFITGFSEGKQVQAMVDTLMTYSPRMVLVNSHHPRALPAPQIAAIVARESERLGLAIGEQVQSATSMDEALDLAAAMTPPDGLRVGTGSVFVAAELREAWATRFPHAFPPSDWVFQAPFEPEY